MPYAGNANRPDSKISEVFGQGLSVMKAAPVISLGLSVLLGAAALIIGRGWLFPGSENAQASQSYQPATVSAQEPKMRSLLVSRGDIESGMMITPDLVTTDEWPESARPAGALDSPDDLLPQAGQMPFARGFIAAGEPLLAAKLAYEPPRRYLAQDIPEGKRAASISVTLETGVAGFVLPGNRVDINAFKKMAGETGPDAFDATPLLKGALVLAVDQYFDKHAEGALPSRVVTLALSEEEVLKVTSAARDSQLGLALIGDDEAKTLEETQIPQAEPRQMTVSRTVSPPAPRVSRVSKPAPKPKPVPKPAQRVKVDVVHGIDKETVEAPVAGEGAAS